MKTQPVKLKNITDKITKGTTPTTMGFDFIDYGINFIKAEALNGDSELDNQGFAYINDNAHNRLKRSILQKNDVLVTIAGVNIGKVGIVKQKYLPANTNQAVGIIRINPDLANSNYVYYWFKNPLTFNHLQNINSQAAQPNINLEMLGNLSLLLPDIQIQQRIASSIIVYDELINTNRRRIQLLEESARLLFCEWFVYFRFPGHEKVKIVDGVPEGWEGKKLNKFVSFFGGHAFKRASYKQEGKYGIVTIKNVQQNNFIPKCTDYLDYVPNSMRKHCFLTNGDILISLTGNVGRVCLVYGENYLLNQRVAKIEAKNKIPKSFIYWMFDNSVMQKRVENLSYGAAQQNLSPIKLGEQKVILPPDLLLESFDEIISLINIEIIQLLTQNQKLAQARDLLLPRLMSGEIEV